MYYTYIIHSAWVQFSFVKYQLKIFPIVSCLEAYSGMKRTYHHEAIIASILLLQPYAQVTVNNLFISPEVLSMATYYIQTFSDEWKEVYKSYQELTGTQWCDVEYSIIYINLEHTNPVW